MRRFLTAIVISMSLFAFNARNSCGQEVHRIDPEDYRACGIASLFTCARLQGIRMDLAKLESALPESPQHSLDQLQSAARNQGVATVAAHLGWSELAQLNLPTVLHLSPNDGSADRHFISLIGITENGGAWVIDAPEPPKRLNRATFEGVWTGNCLIVCSDQEQRLKVLRYLADKYPPLYRSPFVIVNVLGAILCGCIWRLGVGTSGSVPTDRP